MERIKSFKHAGETFTHAGKTPTLQFVESNEVFPGVICDSYSLDPDAEGRSRDVGIIYMKPGVKTKPQQVLSGEETIAGYISGKGRLIIIREGEQHIFEVGPENEGFSHSVEVGDTMQWQAVEGLVLFEICIPPYEPGRYKDLDDSAIDL
jgi:hypothetical protein